MVWSERSRVPTISPRVHNKLLRITTSGTQGFHLGLVSPMILVFQDLLNEPCTSHPLSSGAAQYPPRHRLCPQAASCRPLSGKEALKWGYGCDRAQVAPPHSPPPPRTFKGGPGRRLRNSASWSLRTQKTTPQGRATAASRTASARPTDAGAEA